MKKVSKSTLKAKMFEYFNELEEHGGELVVTDFGKPVLKVVPYQEAESIDKLFGEARAKAKLTKAAVLESTEEEWGNQ